MRPLGSTGLELEVSGGGAMAGGRRVGGFGLSAVPLAPEGAKVPCEVRCCK